MKFPTYWGIIFGLSKLTVAHKTSRGSISYKSKRNKLTKEVKSFWSEHDKLLTALYLFSL